MKIPSVSGSPKSPVLRYRFVLIVVALVAAFFPLRPVLAIPIPVELGVTGLVNGVRQVDVLAPDVQFQGQNIDLDFSFQGGEFIRLFTLTTFFQVDVFFRINNAPIPQTFTGSGYLTNINGDPLGPSINLQAFPATNGIDQVGVDLLLRPLNSNATPGDAYGFHLDLTLPDSPGFGFVNSPFPGGIVFDGNIFGIGPGIPADVTSEGGDTFGLLALSSVLIVAAKVLFRRGLVPTLPSQNA